MKKIIASVIFSLISFLGISQTTQTKGISYQAVIIDPNPIELPGEDISMQPYVSKDVWIRFGIYSGTSLQYEEIHKTKTDEFGLVNLVIGTGINTGKTSSIAYLNWDGATKNLVTNVSFDKGINYKEVSNQKLTYVPYSFYAESAGKLSGVLPIGQGGTGASNAIAARMNLGLGNLDNTSDADKPVSLATLSMLDGKESLINKSNNILTDSASNVKYPSVKAIKDYVDSHLSNSNLSNQSVISLSAQKLSTARTINGVPFDGTADITIPVGSTIFDADASTKGILKLSGDLSGTAESPSIAIGAVVSNKLADGSVSSTKIADGSVTDVKIASISGSKVNGNISGNAATATLATSASKLTIPRKINGVPFDGSSDITIATNSGNLTGTISISNGGTGANNVFDARTNLGLEIGKDVLAQRTFGTAANSATTDFISVLEKGSNNGVATLGVNGKIPSVQIPAISFQNVTVVNSDASMTAISGAVVGSIAIRTDNNNNYVLSALPASTLSNWIALATPLYVSTVNSYSGPNISLTTNDIPEGSNNKYFSDFKARNSISALAPLTYDVSTGVFSVTTASANSNGFLNASDYVKFNNKQSQLTAGIDYVSPTGNITGNAANVTGIVSINNGGTGANTAALARTNLGLGYLSIKSTILNADVDANASIDFSKLNISKSNITNLGIQEALTPGSGISIASGNISATGLTSNNLASNAAINNGQLANSSMTLGSTILSLGGTVTSVTGLNSLSATNITGNLIGNSSTATKLASPRRINGVSFDGSSDIYITSDVSTLSGTSLASNVVNSSLSTVGTITSGVWSGTVIGSNVGGAGNVNGILKSNGSGIVTAAIPGTDFQSPITLTTIGTGAATLSGTTLNIPTVSSNVNASTISGTVAVANGGTGVTSSTGNGSVALSNSPSFTGIPTAPTATAGTNTTQLATTEFVTSAISTANATISNLTGPIVSVGNTTSIASQTGSGTTFVMNNSPTLVTPILGVATVSSINNINLTAPLTSATLTIADGKTLTSNNSLTLVGTDATTMTFPSTNATLARTDAAQTFTGTQTFSSTIVGSISGNAATATSFTGNLSGDVSGTQSSTIVSKINGTSLAGLSTGLLKNTTSTGVPTIAIPGSDYLVPNSSISGATKTKITYDTKGLVISGIDATTADIAPSTNRNYVTDSQAGVISNTSGINTGDETTASIKTKLGISTLSGSNTGDQTITLSGDVTGTGTGTFSTTISNSAITYNKIQNITAGKLIGSISSIDAAPGAISIGTGLNLSNGTLSSSGGTVTNVLPITVSSSGNTFTSTVSNSSTIPAISLTMPLSSVSGTTAGLLSNSDYLLFSGKQNALTNPVTGTGTVNYLPKWTGSTTQGNSSIQDDGSIPNHVSIAYTTNPATNTLDVNGKGKFAGSLGVGITTSSPITTLHVNQIAGTTKGILISGDEEYTSGNGDASNGVRIALGVNRNGNRQLWIGDNSNYGSNTKGLFRYQTGSDNFVNLDATSGDGTRRILTILGTETSNIGIGYDGQSPTPSYYSGKLNSFVYNSDVIPNLILRRFGLEGDYLQNINTNNKIISGFNSEAYLYMSGATSGKVIIKPQSTTANYTLTLPNSAGTSGQILSTDGTGSLSWTNAGLALSGGTLSGKLSFSQVNDYNAIDFNRGVTPTFVGGISVSSSQVYYNQTSDYRLKQDFKDFNALKLIDSIKVYDYQWKSDMSRSFGVKAHELQNTIPYVVHGEKDAINSDGTIAPQSVDYSKLVPVLIKAIQELKLQNEILQTQISTIKKAKRMK